MHREELRLTRDIAQRQFQHHWFEQFKHWLITVDPYGELEVRFC
jgi:hypothetical protein